MNVKVIIVYILTFVLILSNTLVLNGMTLFENVLSNLGVNAFYSHGATGFYYPTIVMLVLGVCFWLFLLKSEPTSKFSKHYFYYCFGMLFLVTIINR